MCRNRTRPCCRLAPSWSTSLQSWLLALCNSLVMIMEGAWISLNSSSVQLLVLMLSRLRAFTVARRARGSRQGSPVAALQAILTDLSPQERELVKHSLFLGVGRSNFNLDSAEPSKPGAFLVRNLIGVDPRNGAVAVAERMRVGQQVQFQLRDAEASRQELRQLLAQQQTQTPNPLATLLFACLGRGEGLYGAADGDVNLCREAFQQVPIAGVFCNGEIGPAAGNTHLHGYTASLAFLVPRGEG